MAVEKANTPYIVTSNPCIQTHWSEVEACFACDIIHLFSVVFCMVRFVHKFAFRLVTNKKPKRRPVERSSCSDGEIMFLTRSLYFPPTVVAGFALAAFS